MKRLRANKRSASGSWVRTCASALVAALTLSVSSNASADIVTLSQTSSDATPASVLSATLDFTIINGGNPRLTLTVTNDTLAPNEYNITSLYFNSSDLVTDLSLTKAVSSTAGNVTSSWSLIADDGTGDGSPTHADGFGMFDWVLMDGVDGDPGTVQPEGGNIEFTLPISGTGPFSPSDFILLSQPFDGNIPSLVAGMFVAGPGDDSAFGSTQSVPEPPALLVLALGLASLAALRRRTRTG